MIFALIILYVVTLMSLSITERFRNYASIMALQGWILLGVALLRLHSLELGELLFIVAETLVFKAIIVPYILFRIIHKTGINRVRRSGRSQFVALSGSIVALLVSIIITGYVADSTVDMVFFGVALYAVLTGLILIVARTRIFSHLVGFLVIENGVFLFSMAVGLEMPFLVNIAILLDILMSVLMLGMFLTRLGTAMHDTHTEQLTNLKD